MNLISITKPVAPVNVSGKADKVTNAVEGNVAALDANGNLIDGNVASTRMVKNIQEDGTWGTRFRVWTTDGAQVHVCTADFAEGSNTTGTACGLKDMGSMTPDNIYSVIDGYLNGVTVDAAGMANWSGGSSYAYAIGDSWGNEHYVGIDADGRLYMDNSWTIDSSGYFSGTANYALALMDDVGNQIYFDSNEGAWIGDIKYSWDAGQLRHMVDGFGGVGTFDAQLQWDETNQVWSTLFNDVVAGVDYARKSGETGALVYHEQGGNDGASIQFDGYSGGATQGYWVGNIYATRAYNADNTDTAGFAWNANSATNAENASWAAWAETATSANGLIDESTYDTAALNNGFLGTHIYSYFHNTIENGFACNAGYVGTGSLTQGLYRGAITTDGYGGIFVDYSQQGVYKIDWSMTVMCSASNQLITGAVKVNGSIVTGSENNTLLGAANTDKKCISGTCIAQVNYNPSYGIEIVAKNSSGNVAISVPSINVTVTRLA